jgi:hypothetical protein
MIDALTGNTKKKGKKEEKTEVVEKVKEDNSEKFNTVPVPRMSMSRSSRR